MYEKKCEIPAKIGAIKKIKSILKYSPDTLKSMAIMTNMLEGMFPYLMILRAYNKTRQVAHSQSGIYVRYNLIIMRKLMNF